jgi:hypothetical protein
MKTFLKIRLQATPWLAVLTAAGLLTLPFTSLAFDKGAERLVSKQRAAVSAPAPAGACCAQCADTPASVVEKTAKAVQPEIKHQITRHQCAACTVERTVTGHGKLAQESVQHVCKMHGN